MVVVRGADEMIVGYVKLLPEILYAGNDLINILLGSYSLFFGDSLYFLAVLVRSGKEFDIIAPKSFITRHCIRSDGAIGVSYMEFIAGIIDRRSYVEFFCHFVFLLNFSDGYIISVLSEKIKGYC